MDCPKCGKAMEDTASSVPKTDSDGKTYKVVRFKCPGCGDVVYESQEV